MNLKWYRFKLSKHGFQSVSDYMLKTQFNASSGTPGFLIDEAKKYIISGIFIEPVNRIRRIIDAVGNEVEESYIDYNRITFSLTQTPFSLEIIPGRYGTKNLLATLIRASGNECLIQPVTLDLGNLLSRLKSYFKTISVSSIRASGITLSPHTSGSLSITGTAGVVKHWNSMVGGRAHKVLSVGFSKIQGTSCDIYIGYRGTCSFSEKTPQKLVDEIKKFFESEAQ